MPDTWQQHAQRTYERIKTYYEQRGGTKWPEVSANPALFNRVWNAMLGLKKSDMPPPVEFR